MADEDWLDDDDWFDNAPAPLAGGGSGGSPVGGSPLGGNPLGGNPLGGNPMGGNPMGGNPLGGNPMGGNPLGGNPMGGSPAGSNGFNGASPLCDNASGGGLGDMPLNADGKPFNYKMIGLGLAGALVVVAVILVLLGRAGGGTQPVNEGYAYNEDYSDVGQSTYSDSSYEEPDLGSQKQGYAEFAEEPSVATSVPVPEGEVHGVDNDGITLTVIPDDMDMDMSGDTHYVTGAVSSKERLLQDGQVICRINIVSEGYSFYYYCAYNAYDAVSNGDILTVAYKRVSDTCITILSVELGTGS